MAATRKIEIFSAGCLVCEETIAAIRKAACPSCDVIVLDMNKSDVARRAMELGVRAVPAVAIAGMVSACCTGRGVNLGVLRAAGLGQG